MYDAAYNGNRAPLILANHFNEWNSDSFNPPALDFMLDKCGQPDTVLRPLPGRHRLDGGAGPGGAGRCRTSRRSPPDPDPARARPSASADPAWPV